MAPDVVHGNERNTQSEGRAFGEIDPNQHRADEAGGVGAGHGVDVGAGDVRRVQSALGQKGDDLQMAAGGDLGHHAAVDRVQVRLGEDLVRQHPAAVLHQGDGGLVAGGFNR